MLKNIYVAGGVRTPFGSFNGSLSSLTAAELGGIAIRNAVERAGVDAKEVDVGPEGPSCMSHSNSGFWVLKSPHSGGAAYSR